MHRTISALPVVALALTGLTLGVETATTGAQAAPRTTSPPSQPRDVRGLPVAPTKAKVKFRPPSSEGSSPIIRYDAMCLSSDGGASGTGSAVKTVIVVRRLTPGKTYTCVVQAVNSDAPGPFSAPSAPFTLPQS